MRFAVLLALCGLALATRQFPSSSQLEDSYRAGREYRYKYDGHLSTGLQLPGEQSAATRVRSTIRVQPENDRTMRLQMTETRFATSQESRVVDFDHMKETRVSEKIQETLSLPVRFSYRHGMVGEIEFQPHDQTWSMNMKKAVINMLQINLSKKGVNAEKSTDLTDRDGVQSNDYFVSTERTLEGECEVAYTQIVGSENEQQWTKSINFEKCSTRPQIVYGRHNAEECKECNLNDEKLSSTVMVFNITGSSEQHIVNSVELKSKHIFAALTEKQQLLVTKVLSRLQLVQVEESQKEIESVRSSDKKEDLLYNPEHELAEEQFAQTGDEKFLRRLPFWVDQIDVLRQAVNRLAKSVEQGVELETVHNLARLVKQLRFATEDNLSQLRRLASEKQENFQSIYLDALALAGTKVTVSHLVEKINNKEISPMKAAQLMKMIAEVRIPSEQIAEEVFRLCESDVSLRNAPLRQSCWLSYGSIVHGACGEHKNIYGAGLEAEKKDSTEKKCTRPTKEKIIRQLIEKMNQADTRYEKVLFIKAIANAGLDVSVVELEKIIRDQTAEKTVRMQAIDALRRLRNMPRKVQKVLLPIHLNEKESPEIRMLALNMLLQSQPNQGILDTIARSVQSDRSQQVRLYTFTTFKTLSESKNPAEMEVARRCAQALMTIPEEKLGYLESKHKQITLIANEKSGLALHFASLFSNDSVLPKEITASVESLFGGDWNRYLGQIGLVQNNLDVVLAKALQKIQENGLEQLVVRGKRSSAIFRPAEMLQNLIQSLRISHRQVSSDEPHAMLYLRYKDMDVAFLPIDIDTLPELLRRVVRDGQLDLSEIEKVLSQAGRFALSGSAFFHETHRKVISALGMPLVMTAKMPTIGLISGDIKIDLEPKNSDRFNGLRLRLQAKPELAATHVTKVELLMPVGSLGVKLLQGGQLSTPIDTTIEVNWEKKVVIKVQTKAPEQKRHVAHFFSRPVAFVRAWNKDARHYPEPKEVTIQVRQDRLPIHNFNREYFEETGMKVVASGHYRRPMTLQSALISESVLDVVIEPTEDAPKEIHTQLILSAFEEAEMEEPRLIRQFFKKERTPIYETDSADVEEEQRDERREKMTEGSRKMEQLEEQLRKVKTNKAVKHSIHMKVQTIGGLKKQEAELQIRGVCDENVRFCRVQLESKRSPMKEESRQWELKSTMEWIYPQQPSSLKKMLEQPHRELICMCETQWGADQKNEVVIRIQGEQSQEQKRWMKKADREQNILSQEQKLIEASKLNQFSIQADYTLNKEARFWLKNMANSMRSAYFLSTESRPLRGEEKKEKLDQGHIVCRITIEPEMRQLANLTIETESERIKLREVQMPVQLPVANIRRHFGSIRSARHVVKAVERSSRPECVVKSKEIQTFDEVFYRTPITTCYSVLAKDCSEENNFAVLMKKVRKDGQEKKLKVISKEKEIVLEKTREGEIEIRVNGEKISEEEMENNGIYKRSEDNIQIDIEHVTVDFDGVQAKIQMSSLFKNKQCGLCGHYDGEKTSEFRRADDKETEDLEEFSKSYLHQGEECEMDQKEMDKKRNYKLLREETSSSEEEQVEQGVVMPVLRNRVIENGERVCFSEKAYNTCADGTTEEEVEKKSVTFKCIARSDPLAQELLRRVRRIIISDQLNELTDSIDRTIRIPSSCSIV